MRRPLVRNRPDSAGTALAPPVAAVVVVRQRSSAELVDLLDLFRSTIMGFESPHEFLIRGPAVSQRDHRNEDLSTFAAMKPSGPISAPVNM